MALATLILSINLKTKWKQPNIMLLRILSNHVILFYFYPEDFRVNNFIYIKERDTLARPTIDELIQKNFDLSHLTCVIQKYSPETFHDREFLPLLI